MLHPDRLTTWLLLLVPVVLLKVCLTPGYFSTDFHVHRTWLYITDSLPLEQWYRWNLTEFTLDYPPFFAFFEWLLASCVRPFASELLLEPYPSLSHGKQASFDVVSVEEPSTPLPVTLQLVLVHRLTVIASDALLVVALYLFLHRLLNQPIQRLSGYLLGVSSVALLIVDHLHFQYNGFLSGIKVLALWVAVDQRGSPFWTAALFTALVHFKHIYLYMAPAYCLYVVRHHCCHSEHALQQLSRSGTMLRRQSAQRSHPGLQHHHQHQPQYQRNDRGEQRNVDEDEESFSFSFSFFSSSSSALHLPLLDWSVDQRAVLSAASGALLVIALAWLPFLMRGVGPTEILQRLFPFGRGLLHAYWAPNLWALYASADFALARLLSEPRPASASGLVGVLEPFAVLPVPSPGLCALLTLLCMLPAAGWRVVQKDCSRRQFVVAVAQCTMASFMTGYHVHEKACIMFLLPLSVAAVTSLDLARCYLFTSTLATFSLSPLLYQPEDILLKAALLLFHVIFSFVCLRCARASTTGSVESLLPALPLTYLLLGVPLFLTTHLLLPWLLPSQQFLPLLLTSLYCALGMCASFLW
eukprot:CAMPEP_0177688270 /NCGR_PEP_ID=MMETSP0447-20121125/34569_1 /TAXON_ID=0 /ORGANISM="Stygamoeba regulata, Strain BSH-02190019" /LENGTH=582 /DNA_ID=CAMNT_0019198561 /DNA_START=57 /DNA_END=1803 /DNA_ORIENTATION=+